MRVEWWEDGWWACGHVDKSEFQRQVLDALGFATVRAAAQDGWRVAKRRVRHVHWGNRDAEGYYTECGANAADAMPMTVLED